MGLIFQSQESELMLTGMAVRFNAHGLVLARNIFTTPGKKVVDVNGSEIELALCDEWSKVVEDNFQPDQQVVISLERSPIEEDIEFLADSRHNHYDIKNIEFRPHPMNGFHK